MNETPGPFIGVAPRPGQITVVALDAPESRGPLRFSVTAQEDRAAARVERILAADDAVQAAVRRVALVALPGAGADCPRAAMLGYIARPRREGALRLNEMGALARLRWAEAGLAWIEVSPLWLARFVSDADEGQAAEVWAALDAGRAGLPGGSGRYGWAAALAHVARCAALPERYAPWRAALARELAR